MLKFDEPAGENKVLFFELADPQELAEASLRFNFSGGAPRVPGSARVQRVLACPM